VSCIRILHNTKSSKVDRPAPNRSQVCGYVTNSDTFSRDFRHTYLLRRGMAYRRFRPSHVANLVRCLMFVPDKTEWHLAELRKYDPRDVADWIKRFSPDRPDPPPAPPPPSPAPPRYNSVDEIVEQYHAKPPKLFQLAERIIDRARDIEGRSRIVRDHPHPYTEGGGLKTRVKAAVFETIICRNCRRAFLSRRRDAKTCSAKCRTALHRRGSKS
jgi:hypothetical protein